MLLTENPLVSYGKGWGCLGSAFPVHDRTILTFITNEVGSHVSILRSVGGDEVTRQLNRLLWIMECLDSKLNGTRMMDRLSWPIHKKTCMTVSITSDTNPQRYSELQNAERNGTILQLTAHPNKNYSRHRRTNFIFHGESWIGKCHLSHFYPRRGL